MARIRLEDATPEWLKQFTATEQSEVETAARFLEAQIDVGSVVDLILGHAYISFRTSTPLTAPRLLDLMAAEITTREGRVYRFEAIEPDDIPHLDYPRNIVTFKVF